MSVVLDAADLQNQSWFQHAGLRRVLAVFAAAGGDARVVGGAVRDALLGRAVGEVDLAVTTPPSQTVTLLTKAGIKVVPTGFDHGTVTAIVDDKAFEITTLRQDVETFGRSARVSFTDDWRADAARRDFTFNALYLDAKGIIYDYWNGRQDLEAGHVRFIGDAKERIQEDVLRILRFFRFYAWFGQGAADQDALDACTTLAHLIPRLSTERVWREMTKLLAADNPVPAWKSMQDAGVVVLLLPEANDLDRLARLIIAESTHKMAPSSLRRLAALVPADEAVVNGLARRLKLSRREAENLTLLAILPARLNGKGDPLSLRRAMYTYGTDAVRDAALLLWQEDRNENLRSTLALASRWEKPVFPVQGEDVLALGVAPGPKVGNLLRLAEDWWIAHDFRPLRDECLVALRRLVRD